LTTDREPGPAARHGLARLAEALDARGVKALPVTQPADSNGAEAPDAALQIVAGLARGNGPAAKLIAREEIKLPEQPESLLIRRLPLPGRQVLLVAGSDDRGLMYGLLDVAERIGWTKKGEEPFSKVRDTIESPAVCDRALSIYTMHQGCFEQRFFDEQYWQRYFDMLAANRFNRFVLIFGYENWGYFSPPYPYFFDLDDYPQVRVVGWKPEDQQRYSEALQRMIACAHQHGLEFTVGIWDHIYRGGVQGPRDRAEKPTPGVVWGLDRDTLVPYTKAALAEFLRRFPEIDSMQFRMHGESGLRREEMEGFWTEVYRIMKAHRPDMRFDARAKNFPDVLIDRALEVGIPMRICTKYWMEQMGLPFHPTHIHPGNQFDRRHGYADLLRYPKRYDMHWRLWNAGTTRVLLWGDPEYVRRFAESTHLYDGKGYEVTEPLGTKMQDHAHELPPFELLRPQYRYYDYEFERYWYFFQVFGRIGYNPDTPPEVLHRGFDERFGPAGHTVQQALHRASAILPRIVAYCWPYRHFPTTRGWAERQRQEDLPSYARSLPSDTEQFLSMQAAAECVLAGEDSGRLWPEESARWFAHTSREVLQLAEKAETEYAGYARPRNKELFSTLVDLRILGRLAEYHAHRARAGFQWALFDRSKDVSALDRAIAEESRAVAAWARLVEAAGDVYHDDLMMGRRALDLSGHWRDELVKLQAGLETLKRDRAAYRPKAPADRPWMAHVPVRRAMPQRKLSITCTASVPDDGAVTLSYGMQGGELHTVAMKPTTPWVYRAEIPAAAVVPGLVYRIQATDAAGRVAAWPAADQKPGVQAVVVSADRRPPVVEHQPVLRAPAGKALTIRATVRDPSGVKWVRLRYRSVCQHFDYKTLDMQPVAGDQRQSPPPAAGGVYQATVPAEDVKPEWDFMYYIETVDRAGNGAIHPDLEKTAPYVIVELERQAAAAAGCDPAS